MPLRGLKSIKGPTPYTAWIREEHFNQLAPLPHIHHLGKLTPMKTIIQDVGRNKPGVNRRIMDFTFKGMRRLTAMMGKKGMNYRDIRLRQALYLDRMAAENADHLLERFRSASEKSGITVTDIARIQKIPIEKLGPAEIEQRLWEKFYGNFLADFKKKFPDAREIIKANFAVRRFLSVPKIVHSERAKHWSSIQKIEKNLIKRNVNPEENIVSAVEEIIKRFRQPEHADKIKAIRSAARDTIVAASIYADLLSLKREQTQPIIDLSEKAKYWEYAYGQGMAKLFPLIKEDEELLKEILAFHRTKIRDKKKTK